MKYVSYDKYGRVKVHDHLFAAKLRAKRHHTHVDIGIFVKGKLTGTKQLADYRKYSIGSLK